MIYLMILTSSWKTSCSLTMLGWPWHMRRSCTSCVQSIRRLMIFTAYSLPVCLFRHFLKDNNQYLKISIKFASRCTVLAFLNIYDISLKDLHITHNTHQIILKHKGEINVYLQTEKVPSPSISSERLISYIWKNGEFLNWLARQMCLDSGCLSNDGFRKSFVIWFSLNKIEGATYE